LIKFDSSKNIEEESKSNEDNLNLPVVPKRRTSFTGSLPHSKERSFSEKNVECLGDKMNQKELEKSYLIAFACKKGLKPESPNQDD